MTRTQNAVRRRRWTRGRNAVVRNKKKILVSRINYSQKDNLVVGLLNTDGLSRATLHDVTAAMERERMDVCFLLETKRRLDEVRHEIDVQGYSVAEVRRSDDAGDKDGNLPEGQGWLVVPAV
jgi:hypothetical protein